ncbi:hypothetical protein [Fructilactobacillus frigidiflavus]|uniref:YobI family P-loop NTPase n=1 Tax=Fructilactobacillus frigidiflavus TaxID=3242688 RepID=UPI0037570DF8
MTDKDKLNLIPLYSNDDLDKNEFFGTYQDAIEMGIKDPEIKNISITGKYGSGKSSIIDTYIKKDPNNNVRKYLKVSFASFDGKKEASTTEGKNNIYLNIINQIIYQLPEKDIPLTSFKIKRSFSKMNKLIFGLFLISIIEIILKPFSITNLFGFNLKSIFLFILYSSIFYLSWTILSSIEPKKFNLKIKGFETEIDKTNDDLFDKYPDEIIYLFEKNAKYGRILIIEDLDRFDDITIFEKLRELNTKLNNHSKEKWTFIYLIKDELFVNANDRVKFFELIIPVVPFMNASNSRGKINELFGKLNISSKLMFFLSNFFDDYRILISTYNDFLVYQDVVKNENSNELLSLMAYKNLFPFDFVNLQSGKGFLGFLIINYKSELDNQISNLKLKLNDLIKLRNENIAKDEYELFCLWAQKYNLEYFNNYGRYSINKFVDAKNIINNNSAIYVENKRMSYENFKQENEEYKIRLESINHNYDRLDIIKNKINELSNKKMSSINKEILNDVFDEFIKNIKDDDLKKKISDKQKDFKDFIYVMVKNSFITEDYLDVINNFYGNVNQQKFMRDLIIDNEVKNYDLSLNPIYDDFLLDLDQVDNVYGKKQTLNYHLAEYLMDKNKIDDFIELIGTAKEIDDGFIENFIEKSDDKYNYITEKIEDIKFNLVQNTKDKMIINSVASNADSYVASGSTSDLTAIPVAPSASYSSISTNFSSIFTYFEDIFKNERFEINDENVNEIIEWINLNYYLKDAIILIQEYMEVNYNEKFVSDIVKRLKGKQSNSESEDEIFKVNADDIKKDTLLNIFIKSNKIKPTTSNLNVYLTRGKRELSDTLVKFINENEILIDENISEEFYMEFLNNDKLGNKRYRFFMEHFKKLGCERINISEINLSASKIGILFDLDLLENNSENINYINNEEIIINNISDDYIQTIFDEEIELNSNLIKIVLLGNGPKNNLIISRNLDNLNPDQIKKYLLKSTDEESNRLLKIINNGKIGVKGFKNDEFILNFAKWMGENNIISNSKTMKNGKIKLVK